MFMINKYLSFNLTDHFLCQITFGGFFGPDCQVKLVFCHFLYDKLSYLIISKYLSYPSQSVSGQKLPKPTQLELINKYLV